MASIKSTTEKLHDLESKALAGHLPATIQLVSLTRALRREITSLFSGRMLHGSINDAELDGFEDRFNQILEEHADGR